MRAVHTGECLLEVSLPGGVILEPGPSSLLLYFVGSPVLQRRPIVDRLSVPFSLHE